MVTNSVGVDIVVIKRIEKALARWGERFLSKVYTNAEVAFFQNRVPELAARFAGKEAVTKALGTGMKGVALREVEILSDVRGKPIVNLYGRAERRAKEIGLSDFAISLSHTDELAIAFVVANGGLRS